MIYDIVGDVHGQAGKLINLLALLGYKKRDGLYQQNGHTLVFVGDLIDRAPQQKQVLDIVRPMVTEGIAHVVMGNHEYNAICYHTRKSNSQSDEWLRPHNKDNTAQHQAFLDEYPLNGEQTTDVIEWFKTLPIYLNFSDFRVIHACWDQQSISKAHQLEMIDKMNRINPNQLEISAIKNTEQFKIIERLLKGPELKGVDPFPDKDGKIRHEVRTRWWGNITAASTYANLAFWYDQAKVSIPDKKVNEHEWIPKYDTKQPPVFFGHYWLNHTSYHVQQSNVVCLDYSAGKTGPLVAYRFDTTKPLSPLSADNFYHAN